MVSRTVTVKDRATPAVVAGKPVTANVEATGGVAVLDIVPVRDELATSVAVTVCVPTVMKVKFTAAEPLTRAVSAGNTASGSELVKWTVPSYPLARLP